MMTPAWIIHPTVEELDVVGRFAVITEPDETDDNGVWVRSDDSERVWTGASRKVTWEVRGGQTIEPQPTLHLPARAISEALFIAVEEGASSITMLVPEGSNVVIIQGQNCETVIDLHEQGQSIAKHPVRESRASAVVNAGVFSDLIGRARRIPEGGSSNVLPDPELRIAEGTIAIHTDWTVRGAQRSTYRCRAETTGEAQCIAPLWVLHDVVRGIDRDLDIEIDLPVDPFAPIILREPNAWSTYPHRPAGAKRFAADLSEALIEWVGEACEDVEYGAFRLVFEDHTYTVELIDAPDPVIRVATVVCDGLGVLFVVDEFLGHLNETNAGIVGARLWFDEERVWAAIDLPYAALSSISWAVDKLETQLSGFDVFLGALSSAEVAE